MSAVEGRLAEIMALHDVVITNHGSRGSDDAETYRLVAEHDIIPSLVAALRAVLAIDDLPQDIRSAIAAALVVTP